MGIGGVITSNGKNLYLDGISARAFTVPSLFKVGTGTNTPLASDTDLQTPVIIAGGVYTKAFAVGYPVVSAALINITTRCLLASTDANGNVLTEFGIVNTDGSPVLYSHDTFTAITKNNTLQVVFEQIDAFS